MWRWVPPFSLVKCVSVYWPGDTHGNHVCASLGIVPLHPNPSYHQLQWTVPHLVHGQQGNPDSLTSVQLPVGLQESITAPLGCSEGLWAVRSIPHASPFASNYVPAPLTPPTQTPSTGLADSAISRWEEALVSHSRTLFACLWGCVSCCPQTLSALSVPIAAVNGSSASIHLWWGPPTSPFLQTLSLWVIALDLWGWLEHCQVLTIPGKGEKRLSHQKPSAKPWLSGCPPHLVFSSGRPGWNKGHGNRTWLSAMVSYCQCQSIRKILTHHPHCYRKPQTHSPTSLLKSPLIILALVHWLHSLNYCILSIHWMQPPVKQWWTRQTEMQPLQFKKTNGPKMKKKICKWNHYKSLKSNEGNKQYLKFKYEVGRRKGNLGRTVGCFSLSSLLSTQLCFPEGSWCAVWQQIACRSRYKNPSSFY